VLHVHAACPCCISMLHVLASVLATCLNCMHVACLLLIYGLHVHFACPWRISVLHEVSAWKCWTNRYMNIAMYRLGHYHRREHGHGLQFFFHFGLFLLVFSYFGYIETPKNPLFQCQSETKSKKHNFHRLSI
jgi:hypothetical protein